MIIFSQKLILSYELKKIEKYNNENNVKSVKSYIKRNIILPHYYISTLLFFLYFINISNQTLHNYITNHHIIIVRKQRFKLH